MSQKCFARNLNGDPNDDYAQDTNRVVRQFMKHMEPLNYDGALKLVSISVEYRPASDRHGARTGRHPRCLEPFFAPTLGISSSSCERLHRGMSC